ncbi:MAG TPA: hypothetical protein P5328_02050 [Candidatus Paceibacterota bacterium]|nr:hypothetical protein [Candidatus Paceibacterota bacterium]HRZ34465.1 hypothetical protein [Candidatus Paceibacterota bacterium]
MSIWLGGSYQAAQRIVREKLDGTEALRTHVEINRKISVMRASSDSQSSPIAKALKPDEAKPGSFWSPEEMEKRWRETKRGLEKLGIKILIKDDD